MIQCVRACERGGNTWWYHKSKGWMRTGKVIEERLVSPLFHSQPAHLSFTLILPPRVEWETGREMEKVCSLDHAPRPGMTEEAVDHHQNNGSVKAVGTSPLRSVQCTPQLLFQLLCRAESSVCSTAVESKTGESEVFLSLPSFILPKPSLQLYGFCGREAQCWQ